MPSHADPVDTAASGPHTPCSVLGGCTSPQLPPDGHACPVCNKSVHNLCHQALRRSGDRPPNGWMCGGEACRSMMTQEEVQKALQTAPPTSEGSLREEPSSSPCSAGMDCAAKPGDTSVLSTKCPHGQPRHFVCSRVVYPDNCGGVAGLTNAEDQQEQDVEYISGDMESRVEGDAGGVDTQDNSPRKDAAESGAPQRLPRESSVQKSTPRARRTSPRARPTPEPSAEEDTFVGIKAAVADSVFKAFKGPEFQEYVKSGGACVTRSAATKGITDAIAVNSTTIIDAAKTKGVELVATHVTDTLKKAVDEHVTVLKEASVTSRAAATTISELAASMTADPADGGGKKKSPKSNSKGAKGTTQPTRPSSDGLSKQDVTAAAKSGAAGANETQTAELQTAFAKNVTEQTTALTGASEQTLTEQSSALTIAFKAALTEQSEELKKISAEHLAEQTSKWEEASSKKLTEQSDLLKAEFLALLQQAVGVLSNQMAGVCQLLQRQFQNGTEHTESIIHAGMKRASRDENTTPPKKQDVRRRSPKQHRETRLRDEADGVATTNPGIGQQDFMLYAQAMGQGMAQGNANNQGVGPQTATTNGGMGGPGSFGAGQFGAGVAAHGGGLTSQGVLASGQVLRVPLQGISMPPHGMRAPQGVYAPAFGQVQGGQCSEDFGQIQGGQGSAAFGQVQGGQGSGAFGQVQGNGLPQPLLYR